METTQIATATDITMDTEEGRDTEDMDSGSNMGISSGTPTGTVIGIMGMDTVTTTGMDIKGTTSTGRRPKEGGSTIIENVSKTCTFTVFLNSS